MSVTILRETELGFETEAAQGHEGGRNHRDAEFNVLQPWGKGGPGRRVLRGGPGAGKLQSASLYLLEVLGDSLVASIFVYSMASLSHACFPSSCIYLTLFPHLSIH